MSDFTSVKILELDVLQPNFRIYTSKAIELALENQKEMYFGQLEPDKPQVDLTKVSHMAQNLRIENGYLMADVKVLETPMGKVLKEMQTACGDDYFGYQLGGHGKMNTHGKVTDLTITSIDIVRRERNEIIREI